MKFYSFATLIFFLLLNVDCSDQKKIQKLYSLTKGNPFFTQDNQPIDFASITATHVSDAVVIIQQMTQKALAEIIALKKEDRNFENTMRAYDELFANYDAIASPIYLMAYTHPDSAVRRNAQQANTALSQYGNEISLNDDLYKAIKSYSNRSEVDQLKAYQRKFLNESIIEFERNGFALSKSKRDELKVIKDELSILSDRFSSNIAAEDDFLEVDVSDMEGLSADYKEARQQKEGTYQIDLSYPSYGPFMKYSKSESARKALFMKYQNRAAPENLEILQQLLEKRREMSNLLGYESYSAYLLADRMAQNPATVWKFEQNLKDDLRIKTQLDIAELQAAKKSNGGGVDQIKPWERSYYLNLLLKEKYKLDAEEVKQYFALDNVIKGLFDLTKNLFDLKYKEVPEPSVWQEDVRMFEVYQDEKLKGIFYLDLHPRANKYNHAACFGIINGRLTSKGYQIPMASLVCNFPEATSEKPALMPHGEVETLFHEFGHVLHQMLTTTELYAQSGTNVARDFVEAPSQIFENWAWNYDVLKSFSRHYQTGQVLPKALFDKMLAAKKVGSGMSATGQVFLGTYDLTLHDRFDPNSGKTTTDILRSVHNEVLPYPYQEGTHFQAAFGHLDGYGSSYYGYMWSLVYAQDMFSVFSDNGILDHNTGLRYRDIILARGSSEKAIDLVKEFLGRAPNNEAFLKELGLAQAE